MVFTNSQPFPHTITPISNITPFTYRDGYTYLQILEMMRQWLNDSLVPEFNAGIDNAIGEFQKGIENAETRVVESIGEYETLIDNAIAYVGNNNGGADAAVLTNFITSAIYARADRATKNVTVPTYDGSGVAIHPSVWYKPEGWNGYKYWMAMSPYPNEDNDFENPSIVASNDGNAWGVPIGVTNPIDKPTGTDFYMSDPYLTVSNAGVMHCFYRVVTAGEDRLHLMTSSDGVTWSSRKPVIVTDPKVMRTLSPSIFQEPDGKWVMYAVDTSGIPSKIIRGKSDGPQGPWDFTPVTVVNAPDVPWHIDVHRVGGEYHMLVQDDGGNGGNLWCAISNNGTTFTAGPVILDRYPGAWDSYYYKSCFVPAMKNGVFGWDTWVCGALEVATGTPLGRTFVSFDKSSHDLATATMRSEETAAALKLWPWMVADTFGRPNGAIGTSSTGHVWTDKIGAFRINGLAAASTLDGNARAHITAVVQDHWVSAQFFTSLSRDFEEWIIARASDTGYYRFGTKGNDRMRLEKVDLAAGTSTALWDTVIYDPLMLTDGQTYGIRCKGAIIEVWFNGKKIKSYTDPAPLAGTEAGLQTTSNLVRWRNFRIRES